MQLSAYLSTSRHGVFYFRWPVPASLHPTDLRTDIKLSLGTREQRVAKRLSPILLCAGQAALAKAQTDGMRYDDIRTLVQNHFREVLKDFKGQLSESGPLEEWDREALVRSQDWVGDDPEGYWDAVYPDGLDGLVARFCAAAGIKDALTRPEPRRVCRRLQLLSRMEHHEQNHEQVFP